MEPLTRSGLDRSLDAAGDGAFVVTSDGRIGFWNGIAERTLGYGREEVLGRPCREVFRATDGNGNRLCHEGCRMMSLVRLGEAVNDFEMSTCRKDGQPVWLNVTLLPVPDPGGEQPLLLHLFRDVTELQDTLRSVPARMVPPPEIPPPDSPLTGRQHEILRLIANGARTRAVADRLHVSVATVRNHIGNICARLGAHSRLEAVASARRRGLL